MTEVFNPEKVTPQSFAHGVSDLSVIETHISWVFLTGAVAYKVKKPMDFGFVDLRTLNSRQNLCERELKLNQDLSCALYHDVVPIGGSALEPKFGVEPAFEYAVKMSQFPQSALLDQRLKEHRFSADDAQRLGDYVAGLHRNFSQASPDSRFGCISTVAGPVFDNYRVLRGRKLPDELRSTIDACCQRDVDELRRLRVALSQRRRDGFIRDCHGDLHLANLIMQDDRITAFDRLEFDDALRFIDVINEASFPFMDLFFHKREDLAFEYINAYLEKTGDYRGLAFLPLYARYKAMIRAKVTALHAGLGDAQKLERMQEHVSLARQLSNAPAPHLLLMRGLSRSGKSWLSSRVKRVLPAIRIRADVERKRLAGLSALESSSSEIGQKLYSAEHTRLTYQTLCDLAQVALTAGFSVIVDATFLNRWQRKLFIDSTTVPGHRKHIIDCQAPLSMLRERIRQASGDDPSEANDRVLDWQIENAEPLSENEQAMTIRVDTSQDVDVDSLVEQIKIKPTDRQP